MIKKGRHLIKSHMTLEYAFTGIRVQGSTLTPVDWNLTIDLVAPGKKNKTKDELESEAGLTYQKIYFWLDTNLPNILMVDVTDEDDLYIASLTSNIMMYCPDNPSDDMIIQLLHSKVSVLADPDLIIGEMHLKGSDTSLQYTFDCSDSEYILPLTVSDYHPDGISRDADPWWTRDDGFCFEFIRPKDTEGSTDALFEGIVDPMDEFYRMVNEVADKHIGVIREPARIVQVEKWKPKKV